MVVVVKMPDADITDFHPPLRFGKVLCDVESRLAIMTTSNSLLWSAAAVWCELTAAAFS